MHTDNDLARQLARMAAKKGICKEWHDRLMRLDDKDAMAEMYIEGIDFCLSNDFPSNEFIKKTFGDTARRHGVYVDWHVRVTDAPKVVCLGACDGIVETGGYKVTEVFARHTSELNIIAKGNAFVIIDMFDDSHVMVHARDRAKVRVNRYGGTVLHERTDDAVVKITEKNKSKY